LSYGGSMHQKHPPAKIAVFDAAETLIKNNVKMIVNITFIFMTLIQEVVWIQAQNSKRDHYYNSADL